MPFKFGNKNGSKIYKGTTEISKVFKGETLVFSGAEYYLSFDGVDDFVNLGLSDYTLTSSSQLPSTFYVKASFPQGTGKMLGKNTTTNNHGWQFVIGDVDGKIRIDFTKQVYAFQRVTTDVDIDTNKIFNMAAVPGPSNVKYYIDGVFVGQFNNSQTYVGSSSPITMGRMRDAFSEVNIYEASIWSKELTQSEINNLSTNPPTGNESDLVAYWPINEGIGNTINDLSPNNNDGTIVGATWEEE